MRSSVLITIWTLPWRSVTPPFVSPVFHFFEPPSNEPAPYSPTYSDKLVLLVLAAFIPAFSLWWSFLITIRKLELMVSFAAIFLQCIWLSATPRFSTNSFVKLVPCVNTTFILAFDSWWAFLITNWKLSWRSVTPPFPAPNYYFLAGCQSVIWPFIFPITVWQLARRFVLHLAPPSLVSRSLVIFPLL